jgi:hypothetical protein
MNSLQYQFQVMPPRDWPPLINKAIPLPKTVYEELCKISPFICRYGMKNFLWEIISDNTVFWIRRDTTAKNPTIVTHNKRVSAGYFESHLLLRDYDSVFKLDHLPDELKNWTQSYWAVGPGRGTNDWRYSFA